jgi:hypothetical protein
MRFLSSRKSLAIFAALIVAAVASYGAFAYFTSTGSGSGAATIGAAATAGVDGIWITQQTPLAGEATTMYPGGPAIPIDVTVTNNSKGTAYIGVVTAKVDPAWSAQADPSKPACDASDFSVTGSVPFNADIPAAGVVNSVQPTGMTIQMVNKSDQVPGDGLGNQDNCQGASVQLVFASN